MVFQCGACHRVISDTNQLLAAVADLGALVLDGVVGVRVDHANSTEEDFQLLRCSGCDHVVGRLYRRPPQPGLSHMVHTDAAPRYCLDHRALETYELGSAAGAHDVNGEAGTSSSSSKPAQGDGVLDAPNVSTGDALATLRRLETLEQSDAGVKEQLAQLMRVVLALDQRLRGVEETGGGGGDGRDGGGGNGGSERKRSR